MRHCVTGLLRDVKDCWRGIKDVTTPREGRRWQPRGITPKQVLAPTCDPRLHETMYGVSNEEQEKVWNLHYMAVADQAMETARKEKTTTPEDAAEEEYRP